MPAENMQHHHIGLVLVVVWSAISAKFVPQQPSWILKIGNID